MDSKRKKQPASKPKVGHPARRLRFDAPHPGVPAPKYGRGPSGGQKGGGQVPPAC